MAVAGTQSKSPTQTFPFVMTLQERVQAQTKLWNAWHGTVAATQLWTASASAPATSGVSQQRCVEVSPEEESWFLRSQQGDTSEKPWAAALDNSVFRDSVARLAAIMVMPDQAIDEAWDEQDLSGGETALSLGEDPSG